MQSEPSNEAAKAAVEIRSGFMCGKCDLSVTEITRIVDRHFATLRQQLAEAEREAVYLLKVVAPQCKPLPDIPGVISQLNNYIAGVHIDRDAALEREERLRRAVEEFVEYVDAECFASCLRRYPPAPETERSLLRSAQLVLAALAAGGQDVTRCTACSGTGRVSVCEGVSTTCHICYAAGGPDAAGMKFVVDPSAPEGTIEVRHPDGRMDRIIKEDQR